jgi:hypothetical protein
MPEGYHVVGSRRPHPRVRRHLLQEKIAIWRHFRLHNYPYSPALPEDIAAYADFAEAPVWLRSLFVHELTHVWQAQNGVSLLLAKIKAGDSARSYAYDLNGGVEFLAMNIEQQAMVVEHAFVASRGGETPHPAPLYAAASAHWRAV